MSRRSQVVGPVTLGLLALVGPSRCEAQVALAPGVGTIPDGIAMTAVPAVSADRRYVRLSVAAGFQTVDGFTTLPVPFGVSGLGFGAGLGGLGGGAGAIGGVGGGGAGGNAGGLAAAPMGMNGPTIGPSLTAEWPRASAPPLGESRPAPAVGAPTESFDHSFRTVPDPTPVRKAPKSSRPTRSSRSRGKTPGSAPSQ